MTAPLPSNDTPRLAASVTDSATQLAESDTQLRAVLTNMQDALLIADDTGRILLCNPAVEKIFRVTCSSLVDRNLQILLPEPYFSDSTAARYLFDVRTRRLADGEFGRRNDGALFPMERRSSRLRGASERRFMHVIRDISDRESTRRELLESESRFRDAFNNAPIGLALIDLDGKYLQVNRALCNLLGYSPDELRRLTFPDITHPDDRSADAEQIERIRAGDISTFSLEKRYRITVKLSIIEIAPSHPATGGGGKLSRCLLPPPSHSRNSRPCSAITSSPKHCA